MDEDISGTSSVDSADIHVCIFPNLEEFMVIDMRDPGAPHLRLASVKELLTDEYLSELEREFSGLLRADGPPFVNMMMLAARVQEMVAERGVARLVEVLGGGEAEEDAPRIALFLAAGSVLKMSDDDLSLAFDAFFSNVTPAGFAARCDATFKRLLTVEKQHIQEQHKDELRRAVRGESDQFFTLWQDGAPGGGFSAS